MITEPLTWHVLAENPADLPDADLTVVIELDPAGDASEPVWLGFFDGSGWLDAMGDAVQVIAWADMPKGTAGVSASVPSDEWAEVERLRDLPEVDEALLNFKDDCTGDNAAMVVRAVRRALGVQPSQAPSLSDAQIKRGLDAYWQSMGGIEPDVTDAVVAAMRAAAGVDTSDGGQREA